MSAWVVQIKEEFSSVEPLSTTKDEVQGWQMYDDIPNTEGYKGPDFDDVFAPCIINLRPSGVQRFVQYTQKNFVRRSGKPFESYVTALTEVADERTREIYLYNGCFVLEFIYTVNGIRLGSTEDSLNLEIKEILKDPEVTKNFVHDILLLRNQVPLFVLQKLHCLWTGDDRTKFLKVIASAFIPKNGVPNIERVYKDLESSANILDVYRRILVHRDFKKVKPPGEKKRKQAEFVNTNIPAATELHSIRIGFATSDSTSLIDISFQRDTLKLPKIIVDGSTKWIFLNIIAFEQLHKVITRKEVNEYMYLMGCLIQSADDASLLQSRGIIVTTMHPYEVNILFRRIFKVISLDPAHLDPEYSLMLRMVRSRFNKLSDVWRKDLFQTYLRSPWAVMSLVVAVLLFTLSFIQTFYTVLSYVHPK